MMFTGTSQQQDTRFSDKEKKLLKQMRFGDALNKRVDMSKVKLDVIRPWISKKITDFLHIEDDVIEEFVYNQLEEKYPCPKKMQINMTGFLNGKNARQFMDELWSLLLSAQESTTGIPQEFIDQKKEEILKREEERVVRKEEEKTEKSSNSKEEAVMKQIEKIKESVRIKGEQRANEAMEKQTDTKNEAGDPDNFKSNSEKEGGGDSGPKEKEVHTESNPPRRGRDAAASDSKKDDKNRGRNSSRSPDRNRSRNYRGRSRDRSPIRSKKRSRSRDRERDRSRNRDSRRQRDEQPVGKQRNRSGSRKRSRSKEVPSRDRSRRSSSRNKRPSGRDRNAPRKESRSRSRSRGKPHHRRSNSRSPRNRDVKDRSRMDEDNRRSRSRSKNRTRRGSPNNNPKDRKRRSSSSHSGEHARNGSNLDIHKKTDSIQQKRHYRSNKDPSPIIDLNSDRLSKRDGNQRRPANNNHDRDRDKNPRNFSPERERRNEDRRRPERRAPSSDRYPAAEQRDQNRREVDRNSNRRRDEPEEKPPKKGKPEEVKISVTDKIEAKKAELIEEIVSKKAQQQQEEEKKKKVIEIEYSSSLSRTPSPFLSAKERNPDLMVGTLVEKLELKRKQRNPTVAKEIIQEISDSGSEESQSSSEEESSSKKRKKHKKKVKGSKEVESEEVPKKKRRDEVGEDSQGKSKKQKKSKKHKKKHKKQKKSSKRNSKDDSDEDSDNASSEEVVMVPLPANRAAGSAPVNDDLEKRLRERALKSMKKQISSGNN